MATVTQFNPLTWSVKAIEIALWKEFTFTDMLMPIGVRFCGYNIL